jgi:hypothetical protein
MGHSLWKGSKGCFLKSLGRKVLETVFDEVIMVDVLDSGDSAHLTLMKRPELGVTLTKLHCWSLTHYSKCVFMDADTLVSVASRAKKMSVETGPGRHLGNTGKTCQ